MFGLCLKNYQPLSMLNIKVEKARKRILENIISLTKNSILFKLENSGALLLWTRVLKIKISSSSLHKTILFI